MSSDIVKLIVSIIICQLAGVIGSFFTISSVNSWYAGINKPSFTPPSGVFGPVWISFFILMGISLFLVWRKGLQADYVKTALIIFGIHLVLNTLWSIMFFGLKSPLLGLIEIVILWFAIVLTAFFFWKVSRPAALLLIPYFLWVSFATFLTYSIWRLN
ncbi:MAG: tryptophan-rich sensory protein [Acidobacteria bacterium]|nr:tryptophan-rich sensory protein [Acidobacteriota bacterium]